jgi:hypothetical protein
MKPQFLSILAFTALWSGLGISSCTGDRESTKTDQTSPDTGIVASGPVWNESDRDTLTALYLNRGREVAGATFTALSGALQKAMEQGGVSKAVPLCNLAALPITDSLSAIHGCEIRRTALRLRNPSNAPDDMERAVLAHYDSLFSKASGAAPRVELEEREARFFAPIPTADFCLSCHGSVGSQIAQSDYALISELYPEDRATDFAAGDLRGMWSITFPIEAESVPTD